MMQKKSLATWKKKERRERSPSYLEDLRKELQGAKGARRAYLEREIKRAEKGTK